MKERPILFSDEMVRAILDGRKTQTRRIVKPQPQPRGSFVTNTPGAGDAAFISWCGVDDIDRIVGPSPSWTTQKCPHGAPGDRLWVKECFRIDGWDEDARVGITYRSDGAQRTMRALVDDYDVWVEAQGRRIARAGGRLMQRNRDGEEVEANGDEDECFWRLPTGKSAPWIPSIFLPRWASRITLEITDVRVQRLKSIGNDDARAEGVDRPGAIGQPWALFAALWGRINGEGSWGANPWVWALTFKRVPQ